MNDESQRPDLVECITALRVYPSVHVEDDAALADALEATIAVHKATENNADLNRHYGRCSGCGEWWPCAVWNGAAYAGLEWLVGASNTIIRRSKTYPATMPADGEGTGGLEMPWCMLCRQQCVECSCELGDLHGVGFRNKYGGGQE